MWNSECVICKRCFLEGLQFRITKIRLNICANCPMHNIRHEKSAVFTSFVHVLFIDNIC